MAINRFNVAVATGKFIKHLVTPPLAGRLELCYGNPAEVTYILIAFSSDD